MSIDKVLKDFKIEASRRGASGSNFVETKRYLNESNLKRQHTTILAENYATDKSIGEVQRRFSEIISKENSLRKGNSTTTNKIGKSSSFKSIININASKTRFDQKNHKDDSKFYSPREFK